MRFGTSPPRKSPPPKSSSTRLCLCPAYHAACYAEFGNCVCGKTDECRFHIVGFPNHLPRRVDYMNNYSYESMRDTFDMSAYFVVGPQDCKGRPITGMVEDALRGGRNVHPAEGQRYRRERYHQHGTRYRTGYRTQQQIRFRGVRDRRSCGCSLASTAQGHQG